MSDAELKRLDVAAKVIQHGTNNLAHMFARQAPPKLCWKNGLKMHHIWHINNDAQISRRLPKAFWN